MQDKTIPTETIQPALFPIEGFVANRTIVREVSVNSDHLRKIDISKIRIRPGFNPREKTKAAEISDELWEQMNTIPDLADKIFASNGPAHPLIGDIHEDGYLYITDGWRRFRAIHHLLNTGREFYANGKSEVKEVMVILNPPGTTDLQRKKKAYAANDNLPLTPMQTAYHYLSFQEEDEMTHDEIALECGVSRQTVSNYIMAALELPLEVREAIDRGDVKMTNALADLRKSKKKGTGKEDDEPIITGSLEEKLKKEEKEKEKMRGDEDEFDQQDNSITGAGSRHLPEDSSSNSVVLGKDSIYMQQQRLACFKQFISRYHRLTNAATQLILADKPEDEEDEERAAILYQKREDHVINRMMEEYDITVK